MKRNEKTAILIFSLITAVITSSPYILGWINSSQELFYTGLLIGVEDGNSYLAKMLAGAKGAWIFKTPYTAFPQEGFFAFFPYLLLGKFAGSEGDYNVRILLFHIFRLSGIGLNISSIYRFIAIFIGEYRHRILAMVLATYGGGLGFLYLLGFRELWSYLPLEFYSPETFGFLSYLSVPHLVWARGLLFLGLTKFLETKSKEVFKNSIKIGLLWNILAMMQPLTVSIGWLLISVHTIFEILFMKLRKCSYKNESLVFYIVKLFTVIGFSSPLVIYTFIAFQMDSFLRMWHSQNIILSPPFTEYLLAYGLLIPFAFIGVFKNKEIDSSKNLLLNLWILLLPFLIYFPHLLQRRFVEGAYVVFCVLAVKGLLNSLNFPRKIWFMWFVLNFLTTIVLLAGAFNAISSKTFPLFLGQDEIRLFEAVRQKVPDQSVILAEWEISTLLPAHAPVRVIIGHGPESIRGFQIQEEMESLYLQDDPNVFMDFLVNENVEYWILNRSNIPLFLRPTSEQTPFEKIYENNTYILIKVTHLSQ